MKNSILRLTMRGIQKSTPYAHHFFCKSAKKTNYKQKGEFINRLIISQEYKSYLEIGLGYADSWNVVVCENKVCVDPNPFPINPNGITEFDPTYKMTSDEFFEKIESNLIFDIIYIDGDHTADQVYKDTINSLNYLSSGGCLILHDIGPPTYIEEPSDNEGCGTAYKAWIKLRSTIKGISMMSHIFEDDDVVGIIHFDNQDKKYSIGNKEYDNSWEFYKENTAEILNLKTYNEIVRSMNKVD